MKVAPEEGCARRALVGDPVLEKAIPLQNLTKGPTTIAPTADHPEAKPPVRGKAIRKEIHLIKAMRSRGRNFPEARKQISLPVASRRISKTLQGSHTGVERTSKVLRRGGEEDLQPEGARGGQRM